MIQEGSMLNDTKLWLLKWSQVAAANFSKRSHTSYHTYVFLSVSHRQTDRQTDTHTPACAPAHTLVLCFLNGFSPIPYCIHVLLIFYCFLLTR